MLSYKDHACSSSMDFLEALTKLVNSKRRYVPMSDYLGSTTNFAKIHDRNFTVFLQCEETKLLERLGERAKSSGRIDDNAESIFKRLRTFSDENSKVEDHLRQSGVFYDVSNSRSS